MEFKLKPVILFVAISLVVVLHSCSIPTTITAVIVDVRKAPVPKANISVTAAYGPQNATKTTAVTKDDGTTTLRLTNVTYPVTVTADDGGAHKFSTVIVNNVETSRDGVKIIQNPLIINNGSTAPVVSPVR